MCEILPISQAFAIDGGPIYGGGGSAPVPVVGTYAGVMLDVMTGSNNLGIFTLSVPQQGLSSGTVFIFTGERTFSGPISGLADPNTDKFVGTLQGILVVTSGSATIETLGFHADGSIRAHVRLGKGVGIASVRLVGSAHVTTTDNRGSPDCQEDPCDPSMMHCCKVDTTYQVRGFKQSFSTNG
ncbi:MAG: hypothetical protein QOG48_475 [Verrucomicrobiota bacterium]